MSNETKPAKPLQEKQATVPDVEIENDEGGVPTEADQSDDTDAKGAPKTQHVNFPASADRAKHPGRR